MAQELQEKSQYQPAEGEPTRDRPVFRPRADIFETDDKVVVLADLPGVTPDDVDINLERRILTIRGRARADIHEGYRRVYAEYETGDFERVFTISEHVDQDNIKASHTNGVLTLELPKAEPAKSRRISVSAA